MSAIGSLSTALTALRKNPIVLAVALLFTLLSESYVYLEAYLGPIGQVLVLPVTILVTPFILSGFLTMVDEALDGSTRLESFVRGGKENYASMLGATLLFGVILFGVSFGAMFVLVFAGVGAVAAGGGGGFGVMLVGMAIAGLIVAVVYMFLQFYDAAIVVSDVSAVDSFSKSVSLVRQNIVSVVGFSIVFAVISLLGQGPGTVLYLMAHDFAETGTGQTAIASESTLFLSTAVTLVLGTLTTAYTYTYLVAYYRSLLENDPAAAPAN